MSKRSFLPISTLCGLSALSLLRAAAPAPALAQGSAAMSAAAPAPATGSAPAAPAAAGAGAEKKPPEEKVSTTRHAITLDGRKVAYTATAGNVVLKDEDGTPKASVFFIAYLRDPESGQPADPGARPVTFSFNGGPGAASLWVH
ncbi:MAG TPA: hypothetical protein VHB47_15115, partial [Thermoanaerobaculia bacterium]|nr:hypothetical protein [Thermoanaerobaculia bacterium]